MSPAKRMEDAVSPKGGRSFSARVGGGYCVIENEKDAEASARKPFPYAKGLSRISQGGKKGNEYSSAEKGKKCEAHQKAKRLQLCPI